MKEAYLKNSMNSVARYQVNNVNIKCNFEMMLSIIVFRIVQNIT